MKTLLILLVFITTACYSQDYANKVVTIYPVLRTIIPMDQDTLTFKAGTYQLGDYVRDANGIVWKALKKTTVTVTPKAGTTWQRITPLPPVVTVESLQAQLIELQNTLASVTLSLQQMQQANIGYQQMLLDKLAETNKKIDDTTLEIEVDDEGIPLATVLGQKVTLKSLTQGKKTKLGDNPTNVKIEQQ